MHLQRSMEGNGCLKTFRIYADADRRIREQRCWQITTDDASEEGREDSNDQSDSSDDFI